MQRGLSKAWRVSRVLASASAGASHPSILGRYALAVEYDFPADTQWRRLCGSSRTLGSAEMEYERPTQLHAAAVSGNLDVLHRSLMDTWAHVDSRDEMGWTVLAQAAFALQLEVVEYLLWNGADARILSKDKEDIIYQLAQIPLSKDRFTGAIHKILTPVQCKNRITEAIISNFPEFQPPKPDGPAFPDMDRKLIGDMEAIMKTKSMLENGKYWTMDPGGLGGCFMQLDFVVDFFFRTHRSTALKDVVDALTEAGIPAVATDKSALEGGASDANVDKMLWKVVHWSGGEWKLLGVSGPLFRGDAEIENSGTVCDVVRKIAALDKLWEVNVGFRKSEEFFSLQHLQNMFVRFALCEGGFRSLTPCRPRGFHQDVTVPVAEVLRRIHGSSAAAFDAIYRTNSMEKLDGWLGNQSMLSIQDYHSHGMVSFLSSGGAATPLDVSNWLRMLHWFVCTADLAIPLGKRGAALDTDDALEAILKRFMGDPLLRKWGREKRKREIDFENVKGMH